MELAHVIVEAEKSHETQESQWYKFCLGPQVSEDQCASSAVRESLIFFFFFFPFSFLFFLFRPSTDWIMLTHIGEDKLLYWVCRFKY